MTDLSTVREDLDQAAASLDDLRVAMREGQEVDLDAFNIMVAKTCKAAVELPQADAPKVRPQLERLLNGLNEVKADIEAEQATINARLANLDDSNGAGGDTPVIDVAANTDDAPEDAENKDLNGTETDIPTND